MFLALAVASAAALVLVILVWLGLAHRSVVRRLDDVETDMASMRRRLIGFESHLLQVKQVSDVTTSRRPSEPTQATSEQDPSPPPLTVEPSLRPARLAALTQEEFEQHAAEALSSAPSFTAFVELYSGGAGYVLDPAGTNALPSSLGGSPDRADLWVFEYQDFRHVYPGFNLRRSEALFTGDAGRPAEARLGWLFEIVPGTELRALAPAIVERGGWKVAEKGRLALPL